MSDFDPYNKNKSKKRNKPAVSKEKLEDIKKLPCLAVPSYGITKEGAEYFEVRSSVSEEDGKTIEKTYYPSYNQKGEVTGFKGVNWSIPKKSRGHFFTVGDVNINNKLFGQHQAEKIKRQKKTLIFLEGEGDVITGWQAIMESLEGTKYEGKLLPHIVGLSMGTGNAVSSVVANEAFIREFEKPEDGKICLGYDNDQATDKEREKGIVKGWDAIEDVAGYLLSDKVFIYDFENFNDPREYYNEGDPIRLGKLLTFEMKKFHPEKIVSAVDITFEDLVKPRVEGYHIPAFPKLNEKVHGFRKKELCLVTAPSGAGKSTIVTEISHSLSEDHGQTIGKIYLEELIQETMLRMIARKLNVNYNGTFKFNPLKIVSEKDFKEAKKEIEDSFFFVDHFGSMAVDSLIKKVKYLEHINKVDFVILDHISMVFSGTATDNERKLIDIIMTELGSYVSSSSIGIIAVSHMKRKQVPEFPKDKDGNKLPVWIEVTKEDLRGSGSLEQVPWVILAAEPEIMPDRSRGRVRLVVLKNRPWSFLGECDIVKTDDTTGNFYDASARDDDF